MENKEKIDSLKFMSETHRREFIERRRFEWKIFFTVLTFYVLAGYTRFTEKFPEELPPWFIYVVWACFILLAIFSAIILWFICNAHNSNITIAERAEGYIESIIKGESVTIDLFKKPFTGRATPRWVHYIWQIATIVLFACGSAIILTSL
jgi:hypothetical protein